jgi:hypothetical protein
VTSGSGRARGGLGATLRTLKVSCPAARDTVRYGESDVYPAVAFPFDRLTVSAFQYQDSLLPDQAPDTWVVQGTNGVLPNGVPLTASWADLRRAYGPWREGGDLELGAMFCAHPHLFLVFDASPHSLTGGRSDTPSGIPDNARIGQVLIQSRPAWSC